MWYDVFTLCLILFATIRGAIKGIVWQLAVIGSIVFCFGFAQSFSLALSPYIGVEPPLNRWIAMFLLYVGVTFLAFGAARLLRDWIEKVRFVEYDRHLGAVLGLIKGGAISLLLTFFVVTLSGPARQYIFESRSGYAAAIVMDRLHPVMPTELHDVLDPYIHQLDRPGMDLRHSHHDHHETAGHQDEFGSSPPPVAGGSADDIFFGHGPDSHVHDGGEHSGQTGPPLTADTTRLLHGISAVYATFPGAQETIIEEIQLALGGVPDQVAGAVLKDWHDDLLALFPDPDPQTDADSPLELRILRQLTVAGISLDSLSSGLRNRLRDWSLR